MSLTNIYGTLDERLPGRQRKRQRRRRRRRRREKRVIFRAIYLLLCCYMTTFDLIACAHITR